MNDYEIVFDEKAHIYLVDGKQVPNVTEILAPLHRSYGKVSQSVLDAAAARGSAVHEAIELIDYGAEPEILPEIEGYIKAYLDWQSVYKPSWDFIEHIVYDVGGCFIGTLDRAGTLNGTEYAVVDLKTSQPTKEALVSVCVQTHAYADALFFQEDIPEGTKIRRYGLFLKKDGTYRFLDCEDYEKKYRFKAKLLWENLLLCYRAVSAVLEEKVR